MEKVMAVIGHVYGLVRMAIAAAFFIAIGVIAWRLKLVGPQELAYLAGAFFLAAKGASS